tara:strand:- start:297 stop:578 length:282 start_codon:yes stop_codon:yes gene_type:complete
MKKLYHHYNSFPNKTLGPHKALYNADNIVGNCGHIQGNAQNLTGDVSRLHGDISGLCGDATSCYITFVIGTGILIGDVTQASHNSSVPTAEVL